MQRYRPKPKPVLAQRAVTRDRQNHRDLGEGREEDLCAAIERSALGPPRREPVGWDHSSF